MRGKTHVLQVWGDLACFTRPEMKVERFSYPMITPSSARGILDAIYWKRGPDFYWQIERIEMLSAPRYIALRRNEVKDKAPSEQVVLTWARGRHPEPIWADGDSHSLGTDQKGRTQRQTMALKNVRYRLHGHMRFRGNPGEAKGIDAQFVRRAQAGKCFYQPYLGCREFPAYFELASGDCRPVDLDLDLGYMLYDVFDLGKANLSDGPTSISVFHARLSNGVMEVPPYESEAVLKGQGFTHA